MKFQCFSPLCRAYGAVLSESDTRVVDGVRRCQSCHAAVSELSVVGQSAAFDAVIASTAGALLGACAAGLTGAIVGGLAGAALGAWGRR